MGVRDSGDARIVLLEGGLGRVVILVGTEKEEHGGIWKGLKWGGLLGGQ